MYFFKKISLIGLGFKAFVFSNFLWIYVGLSHYMKYPIPYSLTIICKKKKIYLFSVSKQVMFNFLRQLKYYKLPNRYKGKGLLEFKQFRGFIMLKKGKKQN